MYCITETGGPLVISFGSLCSHICNHSDESLLLNVSVSKDRFYYVCHFLLCFKTMGQSDESEEELSEDEIERRRALIRQKARSVRQEEVSDRRLNDRSP